MARSTSPARASRLSQANFQKSVEHEDVLLTQDFNTSTHALKAGVERAIRSPHPTLKEHAERHIHGKSVLAREPGEFGGVRRDARRVAPHHFKHGRSHFDEGVSANMGKTRGPLLSALNKGNRAIDFTERP